MRGGIGFWVASLSIFYSGSVYAKHGGAAILCYPADAHNPEVADPVILTWCSTLEQRLKAPDCEVERVERLDNRPAEDISNPPVKGYKSELRDRKMPTDTTVFVVGHGSPGGVHYTGFQHTDTIRREIRSVLPESAFHIAACYGANGAGGPLENSSASAIGTEEGQIIGKLGEKKMYDIDPTGMDYPSAALVELLCHPKKARKADRDGDENLSPREIREAMCSLFEKESTQETHEFITAPPPAGYAQTGQVVAGEEGLRDALKKFKLDYDPAAKLESLGAAYTISYLDGRNNVFQRYLYQPEGFDFKTMDAGWPATCPVAASFQWAHDCKVTQVAKRARITVKYEAPCIRIHVANDVNSQPLYKRLHPRFNSLSLPAPSHEIREMVNHGSRGNTIN
jgi:hypothetical protein